MSTIIDSKRRSMKNSTIRDAIASLQMKSEEADQEIEKHGPDESWSWELRGMAIAFDESAEFLRKLLELESDDEK
jgi:hypothetical protein